MKHIIPISILLMQFGLNTTVMAWGSGVRGGGHVIDVDSNPQLLDTLSKASCRWKQGTELVNSLPSLQPILDKLARLDWYYSSDLKQEISRLNYCFTGRLRPVPANENNSISQPLESKKLFQAGFRWNENVYIDQDIFKKLNPLNQSMLIIHEAMHSYIPMETEDRMLKLRSAVHDIYSVYLGKIITQEDLHYSFTLNEVQFPKTVMNLTRFKTTIQFLKGTPKDQERMILNTTNLDALFYIDDVSLDSLTPWDAEAFQHIEFRYDILEKAIIKTITSLEPRSLEVVLKEKQLNGQNLLIFAYTHLPLFNKKQIDVIVSDDSLEDVTKNGFGEVINEKLLIKNSLVYPSIRLQKIITNSYTEHQPIVGLESPSILPTRLSWIVESIILLHSKNKLSLITSNPDFYRALGLKNQISQLNSMELPIPREKTVATSRLRFISDSLVIHLLSALKHRLSISDYNNVLQKINLDSFKSL